MSHFQIKKFAERLKFIAQTEYDGVRKLGDMVGLSNISNYTKSEPIEPRASVLAKFLAVGIDVNWLLSGEVLQKSSAGSKVTIGRDNSGVFGDNNMTTNITHESSELKRLKKEIKVLKERLEEKDEIISLQKDKIKTLESELRK